MIVRQISALAGSQLRSTLDVSFASILESEAELAVVRAESSVQQQRTRLPTAMGQLKPVTTTLVAEQLPSQLPLEPSSFLAQADLQRADLNAAISQQDAASRFAESERRLSYPTLNALGAAGQIPFHDRTLQGNHAAAGFNLSIPVFNGGLFAARRTEAELESDARTRDVEEVKLEVNEQVQNDWSQAMEAYRSLDVSTRLVARSKESLRIGSGQIPGRPRQHRGTQRSATERDIRRDQRCRGDLHLPYGHYEIGGVVRFFRDRYYPIAMAAAGAQNDTVVGGGFVANARFPVTTKVDVGLHVLAGDGTGRYGVALLPDVTVHPNGTFVPLRNAQGLLSLEFHPNKRLDIFGYAGSEYVQRTFYVSGTGTLVGYAPTNGNNVGCGTEALPTAGTGYAPGASPCLGATRDISQYSAGWVYRIYSGPAGKLQYGAAYSYLARNGWTGVGGAPKATNNFVYTSFRYYIP
ncbi:TolC family protein [Tunturiibacter gelidoferens]|uniref:Uncharacterized protein n=1 Tax=Tunturiibacter gelidiferens TaxID=3069689 RepID=A0A9X0QEZ8_9BACT|nr:TolC family protein [Edaphobacter lichenicola]MBB5329177.1 hypothetical protein [Edaphobacter lichenicola]